jgi:hypothetical protein
MDKLHGIYNLNSCEARFSSGEIVYPYGKNPHGRISYFPNGEMMVILSESEKQKFASPDRNQGTSEELLRAVASFDSYYGKYEVDWEAGIVRHFVEASLFPNWEGEVLVRYIKLSDDVLELSTDEVLYRNQMCKIYLEWVRKP